MFVRVAVCVTLLMLLAFFFKDEVFGVLLAPCRSDFSTYRVLRGALSALCMDADLYPNDINLITTDISSQFMTHLTVSLYLGLLLASPYILFQIAGYVAPALYERERRMAMGLLLSVYGLFFLGMVISYWILFPVSSRFLAGYSISPGVSSMITLDSYMSLFVSLTFMMGVVFQLPVAAIILSRAGLIDSRLMRGYRKHALVLIVVIAAIITPPDVMTLLIVTVPLYLLYEASILCVRLRERQLLRRSRKEAVAVN